MQRHRLSLLAVVCVLGLVASGLGVTGCGGGKKGAKVTGSVTMGGQPQEGVRVYFISTEAAGTVPPQGGATLADGKFTIDVLPGSYKVTLMKWVDKNGKVPGESEDPTQDFTQMQASGLLTQVLPAQYTDPASTPLSAEVPPEGKNLEPFVVEK